MPPKSFRPFPEFISYISPDGLSEFFFEQNSRFLKSEDGFGMPDVEFKTYTVPFRDGDIYHGFRYKARVIQLMEVQDTCNRFSYWYQRGVWINTFRQSKQNANEFKLGTLKKYLPDGTIVGAKVLVQTGLRFPLGDGDIYNEHGFADTIAFIAPDPSLFDINTTRINFTRTSNTQLVYPIRYPIVYGHGNDQITRTFTYTGNYDARPVIKIFGPSVNPVLINNNTGETIGFMTTIPAGDFILADLSQDVITVTNSLGDNVQRYLADDFDDLSSFKIDANYPSASITCRANRINSQDNSAIVIAYLEFNTRYIAI